MCKQYKPPGLKGLMKDVAQTLQQRPWSRTVAPNWQASKHKLHKHQRKATSSNGFQWFTENKNCVKFVVGSEIKTRRKVNGPLSMITSDLAKMWLYEFFVYFSHHLSVFVLLLLFSSAGKFCFLSPPPPPPPRPFPHQNKKEGINHYELKIGAKAIGPHL